MTLSRDIEPTTQLTQLSAYDIEHAFDKLWLGVLEGGMVKRHQWSILHRRFIQYLNKLQESGLRTELETGLCSSLRYWSNEDNSVILNSMIEDIKNSGKGLQKILAEDETFYDYITQICIAKPGQSTQHPIPARLESGFLHKNTWVSSSYNKPKSLSQEKLEFNLIKQNLLLVTEIPAAIAHYETALLSLPVNSEIANLCFDNLVLCYQLQISRYITAKNYFEAHAVYEKWIPQMHNQALRTSIDESFIALIDMHYHLVSDLLRLWHDDSMLFQIKKWACELNEIIVHSPFIDKINSGQWLQLLIINFHYTDILSASYSYNNANWYLLSVCKIFLKLIISGHCDQHVTDYLEPFICHVYTMAIQDRDRNKLVSANDKFGLINLLLSTHVKNLNCSYRLPDAIHNAIALQLNQICWQLYQAKKMQKCLQLCHSLAMLFTQDRKGLSAATISTLLETRQAIHQYVTEFFYRKKKYRKALHSYTMLSKSMSYRNLTYPDCLATLAKIYIEYGIADCEVGHYARGLHKITQGLVFAKRCHEPAEVLARSYYITKIIIYADFYANTLLLSDNFLSAANAYLKTLKLLEIINPYKEIDFPYVKLFQTVAQILQKATLGLLSQQKNLQTSEPSILHLIKRHLEALYLIAKQKYRSGDLDSAEQLLLVSKKIQNHLALNFSPRYSLFKPIIIKHFDLVKELILGKPSMKMIQSTGLRIDPESNFFKPASVRFPNKRAVAPPPKHLSL